MSWKDEYWPDDLPLAKWAQATKEEVDFILATSQIGEGGRILDIACGSGRHLSELTRRGYFTTGVEINDTLVRNLQRELNSYSNAQVFAMDALDITWNQKFDLVLNLYDGAIGYFESEKLNDQLFDIAFRALKIGGMHCCSLWRREYFETVCPFKNWELIDGVLTLSSYTWDSTRKRLTHGGAQIKSGDFSTLRERLSKDVNYRLYSIDELHSKYLERGMEIKKVFHRFQADAVGLDHCTPDMIIIAQKIEAKKSNDDAAR